MAIKEFEYMFLEKESDDDGEGVNLYLHVKDIDYFNYAGINKSNVYCKDGRSFAVVGDFSDLNKRHKEQYDKWRRAKGLGWL